MKNDDTFPEDGTPSFTFPEHEENFDEHELAVAHDVPRDTSSPTLIPQLERRIMSHRRLRFLLIVMAVVVLGALVGGYGVFRATSEPLHQTSSAFKVTFCPFPPGAGLVEGQNVRCGFLTVPEDWSNPQGPSIRLAVEIYKTFNPHPAPDPVVSLGGGPGEAWLQTVGPLYNARNILPNRDLILMDQRGAGYSQPSLRCLVNETPRICYDRLVKSGINLNNYTTLENAADVHALITTLGYRQVNLEGASYGTRLALTVMRLYPSDLRSVVLDSVLPPQVISFNSGAPATLRAFDVLFHGCATDSYCNRTYPHLQTVFYQLVTDLNHNPITFDTITKSAKSLTVHFTGNDLVVWLKESMYAASLIPKLPAAIFQIRHHVYRLLSLIYGVNIDDTLSWGMFYSVMCGEDAPFTTQRTLDQSLEGVPTQLQPALLNSAMPILSTCQYWGIKPVPAIQKEPVRSNIPTLILQGEYDPVTPPANGLLAAQTLSRSYFFLLPGVGHLIHSPMSNCPDTIPESFWNNPTMKPDSSCINAMAEPFFT